MTADNVERVARAIAEAMARKWDDPRTQQDLYRMQARAAISAMQPIPADGDKYCHECGRDNPVWLAPNDVWNRVIGGPDATDDPGGVICPCCFMKKGDGPRTVWEVKPEGQPTPAEAAKVLLDHKMRLVKAASWSKHSQACDGGHGLVGNAAGKAAFEAILDALRAISEGDSHD